VLDRIEDVYRRRYGVFVRVAVAIVGDEHSARDAVHDGFVRAVRHRRQLRDTASAEAWIWRIVVNEARRLRMRQPSFAPLDAAFGMAEASANGEHRDLRARIAALPERQRLAVFLHYYADLDYASIAEALDVAPGTVAATLNAARASLRGTLQEVV
jgi:RNA polymerase sigma factor (sigma-70 family)